MKFEQCKSCRWRGEFETSKLPEEKIFCRWFDFNAPKTCIYADGKETKDRRGTDPNNCLLYKRGRKTRILCDFEGGKKHIEQEG